MNLTSPTEMKSLQVGEKFVWSDYWIFPYSHFEYEEDNVTEKKDLELYVCGKKKKVKNIFPRLRCEVKQGIKISLIFTKP